MVASLASWWLRAVGFESVNGLLANVGTLVIMLSLASFFWM
jgi:hypothetical protein